MFLSSRKVFTLACLALGTVPMTVFALDDFFNDLPVITSASRLTQSVLSSPSAITVIDSAMIEASGFIEIADIFRLVPGFQVAHADGNTYAVINHGDGWEYPSRLQLLIDGRSTYTSALSAIDWNTLGVHIEDIDRIEVVRGPAASAYGANSFAGAINIITKAPELDDKLEIKLRTGNNGEQLRLLRHSAGLNDFHYRVTASSRENNGFDDYRDSRDLNDIAFTGRYSLNTRNAFFGHINATQGEAGMPNLAPELDPGFYDRNRDISAVSAHFRWDHLISDAKEFKLNFYHNYRHEDDMTRSHPLYRFLGYSLADYLAGPVFVLGDPYQSIETGERTYLSHRSDLELQYSEIRDSGLQYVVGLGGRYDSMESEAFFVDRGRVSNTSFRAFGNIQIPLNTLFTANAGGFYEVNHREEPHFSPRLSMSWHISDTQSLRATYSKAYRIPSLIEENMNMTWYAETGAVIDKVFAAEQDVKAEQVKTLDIGYVGRMQQFPLSWEVRTYKEEYDDVIVFYTDHAPEGDPNNELKRIGNKARSTMYGFEGSMTFRPEENSFIRFHFNHGHESGRYIKNINLGPPKPSKIVSLYDGAPRTSYGILAAKAIDTWRFNIGFYHVGAMEWGGRGDKVDSYDRLDASVSKRVPLSGSQELVFRIGGQNIGNNDYSEFIDDDDFSLRYEPRYYASVSFINF